MNEIYIGKALDIGEQMLRTGGEVSRVEDTIARLLFCYDFKKVNVFTITSQIQITAEDNNGKVYSQFRRIDRWGTDLERLEELNQFSRDVCDGKADLIEDFVLEKKETQARKYKAYIGAILAAGGFTMFFGGSIADALITAVLAVIITFIKRFNLLINENVLLGDFIISVMTGFVGNILVLLGNRLQLGLHLDKILIGCIMLSIPGIAITHSVRDMLLGETITGLLRFAESLFTAASIASGFILISFVFGGLSV